MAGLIEISRALYLFWQGAHEKKKKSVPVPVFYVCLFFFFVVTMLHFIRGEGCERLSSHVCQIG